MELEELRYKRNLVRKNADRQLSYMKQIATESGRVAKVASNSETILQEIDQRFESCTGLNSRDISFLFVATALQIVRQYVFTKFPDRVDDQTAAKNIYGHKEENIGRSHRYYAPSLEEILNNPVPFDANIGAAGALSGGKQMGHRVTAIGHDPLLGLFFGTANIATSTLTNNLLQSYHIYTNENGRDYFRNRADTGLVFSKTKDKLVLEGLEGKMKVGTSLCLEIKHLRSDLHTKNSLPLPVISVFNPGMAADLAKRGLDMSNVVSVGKQAGLAVLFNSLIAMIHGLFYDESVDVSRPVYEVRTRKILSYSNFIASSSNLIYVGINSLAGNEAALKTLDVGGLIVTAYRIATDSAYIRRIKQEFIEQEFFDQIRGSEYNFLD